MKIFKSKTEAIKQALYNSECFKRNDPREAINRLTSYGIKESQILNVFHQERKRAGVEY